MTMSTIMTTSIMIMSTITITMTTNTIITSITMSRETLNLLKMLQISDSLFPIGAYTMSNGLETFVETGKLKTEAELRAYIDAYLQILPYNDLGTWCLAYKIADAESMREIAALDELTLALKSPSEVRKGTIRLCSSFFKVWKDTENLPLVDAYRTLVNETLTRRYSVKTIENETLSRRYSVKKVRGNHAIASALYARDVGIDAETGAAVYAYSLVNAIVVNAVKTVPMSQKIGQAVLRDVLAKLPAAVERAMQVSVEDLGVGGTEFDIYAMNHEYLYTRQYMS